jgi:hypothetical protein
MSGGARNFVDNLREDPTPLPFALILLPESESCSRFRGGGRNYVGHYHIFDEFRFYGRFSTSEGQDIIKAVNECTAAVKS